MEKFIEDLRKAAAALTAEQVAMIGREAEEKFGVDKDALMLLLLSGKEEFKELVFGIVEA